MEEMMNMGSQFSGAMPGMPPMPFGAPAGMPAGMMNMPMPPGMEGIPPEMQAVMANIMAQGGDPSQMDPQTLMNMMQQAAAQGGGQGQNAAQGQQGFGDGGGQGYDQRYMGQGRM
jgi:pre-mRNA 3'-end-processing factor FIP1